MNRDAFPLAWLAADWGSNQLRLWALDAEDRLLTALAPWLAADWGSSQLRLWALDAEDRLLAQQSLPQGMARLTPDQFEPTALIGQALVDLAMVNPGIVGRGGLVVTG